MYIYMLLLIRVLGQRRLREGPDSVCVYTYIYIYIYRERDIYIYICIYI